MALRAVPDHPKFAELMAHLQRPKYAVLGCLEAVWHFAGRFTPQGNIGKYSDQAIEGWVGWNGVPGALIDSLVKCRWIDRDSEHRLLVHDWAQHADKATKNALSRAKLPFCSPAVRTEGEHVRTGEPKASMASRLPVPEPEPVPDPEAQKRSAPPKPPTFELPNFINSETWDDFEEMRKRIRKPMTDRARRDIVAKIERLRGEGHDPEDVLAASIANSWTGVFPLRSETATRTVPARSEAEARWEQFKAQQAQENDIEAA